MLKYVLILCCDIRRQSSNTLECVSFLSGGDRNKIMDLGSMQLM